MKARAVSTKPVQVLEAMTEFNKRSILGRVVINPPERMSKVEVHKTGEAWYVCRSCGRGFLQHGKFVEHKKEHRMTQTTVNNEYKSKSIPKAFSLPPIPEKTKITEDHKRKISLNKYNNMINSRGGYECQICWKVYANLKRFSQHFATHGNKRPHKCIQCGAGFKVRSYLHHHIKRSHAPFHTFKCDRCCCKFENKIGLQRHCDMYHNKNAYLTQDQSVNQKQISVVRKGTATAVLKTVELTATHDERNAFITTENISTTEIPRKSFVTTVKKRIIVPCLPVRSGLLDIFKKNEKKEIHSSSSPFECKICKKVLSSAKILKNHNYLHTGEKPHKCKICGMRFRLSTTAWKHRKNVHSGLGTFKCSYCDCSYKGSGMLRVHMRRFHNMNI